MASDTAGKLDVIKYYNKTFDYLMHLLEDIINSFKESDNLITAMPSPYFNLVEQDLSIKKT